MKPYLIGLVFGVIAIAFAMTATTVSAGDGWELDVLVTEPQFEWDMDTNTPKPGSSVVTWKAMDSSEVTKKWNLCVLFPHVKDPYYLATSYGAYHEAKRLGVKLTILEAGGYGNVETQISQMEDCAAQGADGIIVFALSADGMKPIVDQVRGQGVVVQDCGIGVHTEVDARSVISYYESGVAIADWLKTAHPTEDIDVVWLPGPPGVSWVETPTMAMNSELEGTNIHLLKTMYGDSGKPQQLKLVEDAIQTYENLDYILGGAPAIEVAVNYLRELGLQDQIKLIAFYITPGVEAGIEKGSVMGTVLEPTVKWMKLCLAQAVHALEGRTDQPLDASPGFTILTKEKMANWMRADALAPAGWKPIFTLD
jgi:protein TorT